MATNQLAVIGSLNIDFITRTPRMPLPGETLSAYSFVTSTGFGGKGANQAVACARLASPSTKVLMVGQVGDDNFGRDYFEALGKEGIDGTGVKKVPGQTTGAANIIVEEDTGENRILFTGGANLDYAEENDGKWDLVPSKADVVVFQLEVPLRVVLHNMHLAREQGKHVIFNPAPATLLPDFAYQDIDTLVMNETEAHILSQTTEQADLTPLLERFLQLGVKDAVIITLGGNGVMYATASGKQGKVAAKKVKVVDTTAAGDTFLGAYAAKRVEGLSAQGAFDYESALEFATMAAGRTVEKKGAMSAIPKLSEL